MSATPIPGWHGKLPSIGDFASRRLAPGFLDLWDGWLAAGMQALRDGAPGGWLEAYLHGPSWRFVLLPGVLPGAFGDEAWAGVLMPSVDRVGRYFPFTIVHSLGASEAIPPLSAVWPWLDRLDEVAADALLDDWPVDRVEEALGRLPAPFGGVAPPALHGGPDEATAAGDLTELDLRGLPDAPAWIAARAQRQWVNEERGASYWTAEPEGAAARLVRARGLPDAHALALLLGLHEAQARPPAAFAPSTEADDEATLLPGVVPTSTASAAGTASAAPAAASPLAPAGTPEAAGGDA